MSKDPPANDSPEAVALRVAAMAFTRHNPNDYPGDHDDKRGFKLNRALLRAAVTYTKRVMKIKKMAT